MLFRATIIFSVVAFTATAIAQSRSSENNQSVAADSSGSMEPPQVGDHWTYELRDEITGTLKSTFVNVISQVSPNDITIRIEPLGIDAGKTGRSGNIVYDRSWNILRGGFYRYSPNDGTGVQSPLQLNAQWKATVDEVNGINENIRKITVDSRVTGQESITTKAGTFRTYTIETTQGIRDTKNPAGNSQVSIRTWFSPDINHWVRRSTVRRDGGLIVRNETVELVAYGRKSAQ